MSTTPFFDWSDVSGANRYWLMVADNEGDLPINPNATGCPNCEISEMFLTSSSHTPSTALAEDTTYYWQVQAFEWDGSSVTRQGQFSTHYSFTTIPGGVAQTEIFVGQGFDTCEIPTLSQMQNWITNSPYGAVNLYIGGSCRSCTNSALTASYVSQLSQQGWKFIPTWVGPQSACWGGSCGSISNDQATAYNQGVSEANAAIDIAIDLGLALADGSGTIIYYDLEGYDTTNTACRDATKSFISGWTAQLHTRGSKAGVYGSSCGSAISDFASISNVPDAIWPAHWIYSSYNSGASVQDVACLSNSLWANHQRIRQYAGGHDETWGGVTLNIDCNVIDGIVVSKGGIPSEGTLVIFKYEDLNGDSIHDIGEPGLDGWEFNISGVGTRTTSGGGYITEPNLVPGDYTITETAQPDWTCTTANPRIATVTSGATTWINFGNQAIEWSFAIITDLHIGRGYDNYSSQDYYLTKRLNQVIDDIGQMNPKPAFVAVLGDISNEGKEAELRTARTILSRLNSEYEIPYLPIIGNHDTKGRNIFTSIFWEEPVAQDNVDLIRNKLDQNFTTEGIANDIVNFDFTYENTMFIGIDNCGPGGTAVWHDVSETWLDNRLMESSGKSVIIFSHIPVIDESSLDPTKKEAIYAVGGYTWPWDFEDIEEKLESRSNIKAWFAGHVHGYDALPGGLNIGCNNFGMNGNIEWPSINTCRMIGTEATMVGSNTPGKGFIRTVTVGPTGDLTGSSLEGNHYYSLNPWFHASTKEYQVSDLVWEFTACHFTDRAIADYKWDFNNDGVVDSHSRDIDYQYPNYGTYTCNLSVIDSIGNVEWITKSIHVEQTFWYDIKTSVASSWQVLTTAGKEISNSAQAVPDRASEWFYGLIANSPEKPIIAFQIDFENVNSNVEIDLSTLQGEIDVTARKSFFHMPSWPAEVEESKVLYIPSTGVGTVYICPDATSLSEVTTEDPNKVVIDVGQTVNGMTVSTTYYDGQEYYAVSGVTGTGGGEMPEVSLTVNTVGNGSVTKNPDQATYTYGENVQLTATADPGWSFSGWSGNLTGSNNPETIIMDDTKTVTATFTEIVVIFPDPNLEAAIRETIGKPTGDIYQSDLVGLTELWADNRGISDLTGLEYCGDLESLILNENQISDLSPLSNLTTLRVLGMAFNQIQDIYPLENLTNLTLLQLLFNEIFDISPISKLTNLEFLSLEINEIFDISPLSNFTKLTYLAASDNHIEDISPLSELVNLETLWLDMNTISDLTPLSNLNKLTLLGLFGNQISDIEPLVNNPGLSTGDQVWLSSNPLSVTSNCDYIPQLEARSVQVSYDAPSPPCSDIPLTVNVVGSGSVTKNPDQATYAYNTSVQLTADADPGWTFASWNGTDNDAVNPTTVTMVSNKTITATFTQNQYTLSTSASPPGSGNVSPSGGTFDSGTVVTLTASAEPGYKFGNWSGTGNDTVNPTTVTMNSDKTVTAYFEVNNPPATPTNTKPADEAPDVSRTPVLNSSTFSDPDGDLHAASQWQVREASGNYSSPVFDSGEDNYNLENIFISSGYLSYSTTYYWQVRHQDNYDAWSDWSAETSFTTGGQLSMSAKIVDIDVENNFIIVNSVFEERQLKINLLKDTNIIALAFPFDPSNPPKEGTFTPVQIPITVIDIRIDDSAFIKFNKDVAGIDEIEGDDVDFLHLLPGDFESLLEAVSGFQRPMENDHYGNQFLDDVDGIPYPGVDYNGPGEGDADLDTPIYSVAQGFVLEIDNEGWGSIVIGHIYQGEWVYSQYGNLGPGRIFVSKSQIVTKGQLIGMVGNWSTDNAHLHWEIRKGNHPDSGNVSYWPDYVLEMGSWADRVEAINSTYYDPELWVDNSGPYDPPHDPPDRYDTTPPAAVDNLAINTVGRYQVTLSWTSPGDDGDLGRASEYDIRYSTEPITDANWDSATQCDDEPAPQPTGRGQSVTVSGLDAGTTYYFALKTRDEVSNWSDLSNVASGTTEHAYTLTVSSTSGGNVTIPGEGTFGPYSAGATVNLVATANLDYHFVEWTGDVGTIAVVNLSTTTINMNSDYTITANFAINCEVVTFPDPNLEAAIREAIGKPIGDICQSDLDGLTYLEASNRDITDIGGLEHCTSLTWLYLGSNQISDLSPLSALTNLTSLTLGSNQISDISPLSSLTSLTFLQLYGNQISDISPLSSLTSLTSLVLYDNHISDISPLSSLISLSYLDLVYNQISDISPLSSLTSLTSLQLYENQISEISPLSGLTNLTFLTLGSNQISDIASLSSLTSLTMLGLAPNQISNISPLVDNPGLSDGDYVNLSCNPLSVESLTTYIPQLEDRGVDVTNEDYGLNPQFRADKTLVNIDEVVTFQNLTTCGNHPYTMAEWDFDADGVVDLTLIGTEAQVTANVTYTYSTPGIYNVSLRMTDSTPDVREELRIDYIEVISGTTEVWISPPVQTVNTGPFTIDVVVDPAVPIAGVQFDLSFNSTLIEAVNVTEGSLLGLSGCSTFFIPGTINNSTGSITGVAGTVIGTGCSVSTIGTFATINFTADHLDGISPLDLLNVKVVDMDANSVPIAVYNGEVEVSLTPWDVNDDDCVDISDLVLVAQQWGETGADGWIPQDVNDDGVIDISDLVIVAQHWGEGCE